MRWVMAGGVAACLAAMLGLWLAGADRVISIWALEGQEQAQGAMAGALRQLRAGQGTAVLSLMAVCFGYGFFHAAGPGHGKLLIGGYGAAREVGAWRLSGVALASSLAQGATAIALVGAGVWLIGLGRDQMTDMADQLFAPISFAAIAVVGLWLVWRGARGLWRAQKAQRAQRAQGHDQGRHTHGGHDGGALGHAGAGHEGPDHGGHDHKGHDHTGHGQTGHDDKGHDHIGHDHAGHDHTGREAVCSTCGHAHGPDPAALARAGSAREVAALIAAVAIRPCTGALFVLILTAQMGVFWAGVLGTVAMAVGTASVTIAVAVAAVTARQGLLAGLQDSPVLARAQCVVELTVGGLVAAIALRLALAAL